MSAQLEFLGLSIRELLDRLMSHVLALFNTTMQCNLAIRDIKEQPKKLIYKRVFIVDNECGQTCLLIELHVMTKIEPPHPAWNLVYQPTTISESKLTCAAYKYPFPSSLLGFSVGKFSQIYRFSNLISFTVQYTHTDTHFLQMRRNKIPHTETKQSVMFRVVWSR